MANEGSKFASIQPEKQAGTGNISIRITENKA
jgi:hypothetical protein